MAQPASSLGGVPDRAGPKPFAARSQQVWHDASGAPSRTSVGAEEEPEPEADSEPEVAEDAEDAAGAADAATRHSATRMSFIIVL